MKSQDIKNKRKRGEAGKEEKQIENGTVTTLVSLTKVTQDVFQSG